MYTTIGLNFMNMELNFQWFDYDKQENLSHSIFMNYARILIENDVFRLSITMWRSSLFTFEFLHNLLNLLLGSKLNQIHQYGISVFIIKAVKQRFRNRHNLESQVTAMAIDFEDGNNDVSEGDGDARWWWVVKSHPCICVWRKLTFHHILYY